MKVNVKRVDRRAVLPTRGSEYAAGYDLYSMEQHMIAPHTTKLVDTGLQMAIPEGYFGGIFARSGIASKRGLRPANCVGVVDSDYRGNVMVALHNDTDTMQYVAAGERIAQLVILPYLSAEFQETDELEGTARGDGGFGSTGKR